MSISIRETSRPAPCAAPAAGNVPDHHGPGTTRACRGLLFVEREREGVRGDAPAAGSRFLAVLAALLTFSSTAPAAAAPPDESWIKPGAEHSLLVDIAANSGRWVVVGERGHVLVSEDAESWKQVKAPTRVLLTGVDINDQGLGFAVGHDATIIRTRDNGETWERVYHAPEQEAPLLDVMIVDEERVVAVGAYGLYVESGDAGESWEDMVLEPQELAVAGDGEEGAGGAEEELYYDYHLNDIAMASGGRWYIAAEAGTFYRSDDAGGTWLRLPVPYEGSFFGVLPMDGDRVLLFGLQGRLFESGDAGASWRRIDTGTDATLSNGLLLDDGRALITGYAGVVLHGVGGAGQPSRATLKNRPGLSDGYLLENGDLLSVGEGGVRRWSAEQVSGR